MENESESRIRESIDRLNGILSPVGNRVLLLDFSHFLSVSRQHDNITVKTCGLQHLTTKYEAVLEEAYKAEGYLKYGVQEREHYFVCDFSECDYITEPHAYEFGPRRNLNRPLAEVQADTDEALKWFDIVRASGVCSSGIVLARGTPSIQSNIYLFLERKLGIESSLAVRLNRRGKAAQGSVIVEKVSELLSDIFSELNELLRDEMEETAAQRFRQYYSNVAFTSHEIANVESNIRTASTLETAKSFGHGLCIALSVGVDLGAGRDRIPPEISIDDINTFLEAYRLLVEEVGGSLTWSFPDSLRKLERWQAFVIIEITRNAKKHFVGSSTPQIHWKINSDSSGVLRMSCVSAPHWIDPSRWPWQGKADLESMRGTHFIARLAESESYATDWRTQALATGSMYSEVMFELTRKEQPQ